jgi:putative phosphoribosyl transferase
MVMQARRCADPLSSAQQVTLLPHRLQGLLRLPDHPLGIVAFAHGSGSGRLSPRNNQVAAQLCEAGIATLLFDLLSETESVDRSNVFDIGLLAGRLGQAIDWLARDRRTAALPVGLFGASTGAAAALVAAAAAGKRVAAVISRGGRPDLAAAALPRVVSPTLLIVGGLDDEVLELNRRALARMRCTRALEVVPGAGHLFEERGSLERVIELSRDWFRMHLAARLTTSPGPASAAALKPSP